MPFMKDLKRREFELEVTLVMQWLMFQMGGDATGFWTHDHQRDRTLGLFGREHLAVVFERYFPEDVPAARTRYKNETRRLYEVLNNRLKKGRISCW